MAIGLIAGIYQYVQVFQAEIVGAYTSSKPANGHSWSEMECTSGLCITADNKVGIGTDAPAQKLSVAGMIETTSGGIKFPDGTIQTTKELAGPTGATGATGATGPQGPQGIPGVSASLSCVTVSNTCTGLTCTATCTCASGYTLTGGGCGGNCSYGNWGTASDGYFSCSHGCTAGYTVNCTARCCKLL